LPVTKDKGQCCAATFDRIERGWEIVGPKAQQFIQRRAEPWKKDTRQPSFPAQRANRFSGTADPRVAQETFSALSSIDFAIGGGGSGRAVGSQVL
jgi:hypothetical protein